MAGGAESDKELVARLEKEKGDIINAVYQLMATWASMETLFTQLVAACIGPNHGVSGNDMPLASVFIFSPTGLDARINVTKNAMLMMARRMPNQEVLMPIVEKVFAKIGKKKLIRNTVMHSTIMHVGDKGQVGIDGGPDHMRLTPPIFDWVHFYVEDLKFGLRNYGFSANDLKQSAEALDKYRDPLLEFEKLILAWRQRDKTTYERILQQLKDQFLTTPPSDPTPASNESQP